MTLASNQQNIASNKIAKRAGNGFVARHNFGGLITRLQNGTANAGRVFASWVVIGDDDFIGNFTGNLAHHCAFARITIAATAKKHNKLATSLGAQSAKRCGKRIRRMRIINNDTRPCGMTMNCLHAARCGF